MRAVWDTSAILEAGLPNQPDVGLLLHRCRQADGVLAPALLASELGQMVHRKYAQAFGPSAWARAAAHELLLQQVDVVASDEAHRQLAGALADKHGLSFYDAEFIALALARRAFLISQDNDLLDAARIELGAPNAMDLEGLRRRMAAEAA